MSVQVCFDHNKKDEGNGWIDEPNMPGYMLYLRRPTKMGKCPICKQEQNVRDTINALREQEAL
ncbi:MAG: hypothetical protein WC823_00145 [Parcubacteria group bacterium]|jgi:hypothetical protein